MQGPPGCSELREPRASNPMPSAHATTSGHCVHTWIAPVNHSDVIPMAPRGRMPSTKEASMGGWHWV